MPALHRVIWHIYARNFVQKGGSYTHFTQKDYRFFTAFIKKHPFNIGQWIFKEISFFKFSSRKGSYMPFASLVSLIMFYHKIWYVGPPEQMKHVTTFGPTQLKLMKIKFGPEESGQSQAPQRSQARVSQSIGHEAQSAPPPSQSPLPSDISSQIKQIVDTALASMTMRMEFELGKLRAEMTRGHNGLIEIQDAIKEHLEDVAGQSAVVKEKVESIDTMMTTQIISHMDLSSKVDKLTQLFDHSGPSTSKPASEFPSKFGFTTGPSSSSPIPEVQPSIPVSQPSTQPPETHFSPPSSPTFSFPSPPHSTSSPASISTPATVVLSSPSTPATEVLPSPITPSTEILPGISPSPPTPTTEIFHSSPSIEPLDPNFDPSTAMVLYSPPIFVLDPEYADDDDKGGEGKKDV